MTVPTVATYSVASIVAANTSFLDIVDGAVTAGTIKIRDSADILLATIVLQDPSGTVSGITGILTFSAPSQVVGSISGTAAYGEFCDGDGVVCLSMPAQEGIAPVTGYVVLNTLTIIAGEPVGLISGTVG